MFNSIHSVEDSIKNILHVHVVLNLKYFCSFYIFPSMYTLHFSSIFIFAQYHIPDMFYIPIVFHFIIIQIILFQDLY